MKRNLLPRELARDSQRLGELQQLLLRDDQTIRHRRNEDPLDLARQANVSASDSVEGSEPAQVINGLVRDLPGKWENRWGAKLGPEGVWLQLDWKQPKTIRRIQLTFDTGFHRELTHSQQNDKYKGERAIIWGPQPETVRDYELLYRAPGKEDWGSLGKFTGNYQRIRRHEFAPFQVVALRLRITATHGEGTARVYEIRCYS